MSGDGAARPSGRGQPRPGRRPRVPRAALRGRDRRCRSARRAACWAWRCCTYTPDAALPRADMLAHLGDAVPGAVGVPGAGRGARQTVASAERSHAARRVGHGLGPRPAGDRRLPRGPARRASAACAGAPTCRPGSSRSSCASRRGSPAPSRPRGPCSPSAAARSRRSRCRSRTSSPTCGAPGSTVSRRSRRRDASSATRRCCVSRLKALVDHAARPGGGPPRRLPST